MVLGLFLQVFRGRRVVGRHRRSGVCPTTASRILGCLVGSAGVLRPDLQGFFGLLNVRHRLRARAGFRIERQLPPPRWGARDLRLLAPLAYIVVQLAARLSVCTAGRKSGRPPADTVEPGADHADWRSLARGGVAIRSLGPALRCLPGAGTLVRIANRRRTRLCQARPAANRHIRAGTYRLGLLQSGQPARRAGIAGRDGRTAANKLATWNGPSLPHAAGHRLAFGLPEHLA